MEQGSKNNTKKIIVVIVAAAVLVAGIVAAVLFLTRGADDTVNEAYFQNSDRRIVYQLKNVNMNIHYDAAKVYQVYTVKDNKIEKYEFFYEFNDEYAATKRFESIKTSAEKNHDIKEIKQYGKYIGLEYDEDILGDETPDEIRQEISDKENYKAPEESVDNGEED